MELVNGWKKKKYFILIIYWLYRRLIMAETEVSKKRKRPIVRLAVLLLSHSVLVRYWYYDSSKMHSFFFQFDILIRLNSIWFFFFSDFSFGVCFQCHLLHSRSLRSVTPTCTCQEHLHFRKCSHARSFHFFLAI